MISGGKSEHALKRVISFSVVKPEQWERHKRLRGALVLAMVICTLGSGVGWYEVARGADVALFHLILFTVGAIAVLIIVPKKWELITQTFAGYFVLSIIGTVLRRAPLAMGLELIGVTGVLYFTWVYIGVRLRVGQDSKPGSFPRSG